MSHAGVHLQEVSIGPLHDVNEHLAAGEIVSLSGPSGSGKTRLLRAIADLEPHGGKIWLNHETQEQLRGHRWRRAVMMVPAQSHWWAATIGEHFHRPMPDGLTRLGLVHDILAREPALLSSGERQRLALLRALSHAPRVLLLDEPTANLDEHTASETEAWLLEQCRQRALAVLWVAHDRAQIARVADRRLRINEHTLEPVCRA